eukprot:CAMPEP_0114659350 /NCGR_PEP_ID=MMETSP0191-20121206/17657_1 /TAXON_ID=126664 /ORGANISM="Sorites sp." /LENGTH=93 /DNA_ID=CAMNT_0001884279 /DNA_START=20 /DNA_END=302 /DNA_ORIENTATION=+
MSVLSPRRFNGMDTDGNNGDNPPLKRIKLASILDEKQNEIRINNDDDDIKRNNKSKDHRGKYVTGLDEEQNMREEKNKIVKHNEDRDNEDRKY